MNLLKKNRSFLRMKRLHVPAEMLTIAVSLTFGVPFGISLFKSEMEVDADTLEEEFHGRVGANGKPIEKVYFHKGL